MMPKTISNPKMVAIRVSGRVLSTMTTRVQVPGLLAPGALGVAEKLLIGASIELTVTLHQLRRPEFPTDEIVRADIRP